MDFPLCFLSCSCSGFGFCFCRRPPPSPGTTLLCKVGLNPTRLSLGLGPGGGGAGAAAGGGGTDPLWLFGGEGEQGLLGDLWAYTPTVGGGAWRRRLGGRGEGERDRRGGAPPGAVDSVSFTERSVNFTQRV